MMPMILGQQLASPASETALFYVFAALAALSALGVTASRNIVRMAVYLLFTLSSVAGLYLLLSAEFLAAVQVVVYVGGTLILIIFGVMLTSKSPFSRFTPKPLEVALAVLIGLLLLTSLTLGVRTAAAGGTFAGQALAQGEGGYPMQRLGQLLLSDFLVPFELASVLLLVVMIGAAYLAKARNRKAAEER